jgi:hypothetical protein
MTIEELNNHYRTPATVALLTLDQAVSLTCRADSSELLTSSICRADGRPYPASELLEYLGGLLLRKSREMMVAEENRRAAVARPSVSEATECGV